MSVGSKQVRKPKKDGWFEHGQNCHEYRELNFGLTPYRIVVGKCAIVHHSKFRGQRLSWVKLGRRLRDQRRRDLLR